MSGKPIDIEHWSRIASALEAVARRSVKRIVTIFSPSISGPHLRQHWEAIVPALGHPPGRDHIPPHRNMVNSTCSR